MYVPKTNACRLTILMLVLISSDGLQSRDITSSSVETSHSVAAAMASPKPEDIINSPSSAMDSCFSPTATVRKRKSPGLITHAQFEAQLFDSEDSKEDIASSSDSKSLIETLPEAEFQYYAADLVRGQLSTHCHSISVSTICRPLNRIFCRGGLKGT